MKTALILSSNVAASQVGATASAFCLRRMGINTIVLPTTVLGRHPGWGDPGGKAVPATQLRDMWRAIRQQNIKIDAIMTGYLAANTHINVALELISDVKIANPDAMIMVDPVMGDNGRLYIPESRALAIKTKLVPRADIITPNCWEFSFLTGQNILSYEDVHKTAKALPINSLVTSVPIQSKIGVLYSTPNNDLLVSHEKFDTVPHGGGDTIAALFLANMLNGHSAKDSLARSTASIFSILSAASEIGDKELPLIREQNALTNATPLNVRAL